MKPRKITFRIWYEIPVSGKVYIYETEAENKIYALEFFRRINSDCKVIDIKPFGRPKR